MNSALLITLQIQLLLAFFCPPVPWGERQVFGADVWLLLWVPFWTILAFLKSSKKERSNFILVLIGIFAAFGIIFIHGRYRPNLSHLLLRYLEVPIDDSFSFGREAVLAWRFALGCLGGYVVSRFTLERSRLLKTLAVASSIAALSMVLAKISPEARAWMGKVYRYNPDAPDWEGRIYGVFRSPIEASAALSFSALLLLHSRFYLQKYLIALLSVGVLLSKTMTAFIALFFTLGMIGWSNLSKQKRLISLLVLLIILPTAWWFFWSHPAFVFKRDNLLFRFIPWMIYAEVAFSRADLLLLGNGFHPHFSDNLFVFVASRGGLLFSGLIALLFWRWWNRRRADLSLLQRAIPLFILVSGMTTDSLILRPIAYLFITVAIPLLGKQKES